MQIDVYKKDLLSQICIQEGPFEPKIGELYGLNSLKESQNLIFKPCSTSNTHNKCVFVDWNVTIIHHVMHKRSPGSVSSHTH